MTRKKLHWQRMIAVVFISAILAACENAEQYSNSRRPSTAPIKATIKTTIPLAYAASVAMRFVLDAPPPNVTVSNSCSDFPCAAVVTVPIDETSIPISLQSYGSIVVAGLWSSDQQAVLTSSFIDVSIGAGSLSISNVATFPALVTNTGVKIVYASADIDVQSGTTDPAELPPESIADELQRLNTATTNDPQVSVDMDAWVIEVDHNGTGNDFTDDRYTILSGGAQHIDTGLGNTSVYQLGMVQTVISQDCALNPVDGYALLNELSVSSGAYADWPIIGSTTFRFDSTCDGTINVLLSLGTFVGSTGDNIPLYLDQP